MKKLCVLLVFLLGLLLVSCQNQPSNLTEAQKTEIDRQIRDISMKWLDLWRNNDAEAITKAYIDNNSVVFWANRDPAIGKAAILDLYTDFLKSNPKKVSSWATDRVEVSSSGDIAIEYGHYSESGTGADGNGSDRGNYVTVFRKMDGIWKIISDISASSIPATPAK